MATRIWTGMTPSSLTNQWGWTEPGIPSAGDVLVMRGGHYAWLVNDSTWPEQLFAGSTNPGDTTKLFLHNSSAQVNLGANQEVDGNIGAIQVRYLDMTISGTSAVNLQGGEGARGGSYTNINLWPQATGYMQQALRDNASVSIGGEGTLNSVGVTMYRAAEAVGTPVVGSGYWELHSFTRLWFLNSVSEGQVFRLDGNPVLVVDHAGDFHGSVVASSWNGGEIELNGIQALAVAYNDTSHDLSFVQSRTELHFNFASDRGFEVFKTGLGVTILPGTGNAAPTADAALKLAHPM